MTKRTRPKTVRISIRVDVARPVKVKSYKRLRRGRIERVRSHYRWY